MTRATRWIRRWYGGNPLHLLALLAAFALAGYAVRAVYAAGQLAGFAAWFSVAIVAHDLLLFPLYTLADLSVRRLLPRPPAGLRAPAADAARAAAARRQLPPLINHVRVPAAFALLLLLVWFPLILGLASQAYHRASGLTTAPFLWRWLGVTGAMFVISAAIYALRMRWAPVTDNQGLPREPV